MTKISSIHIGGLVAFSKVPDEEHRRIMLKLWAYGYLSTGTKQGDWELLRKIEIKQAEAESCISSKFLTVSRSEQEKIQEKKKKKRIENNQESHQDTMLGQKILGEQKMLAIEMKKKAKKN